MINGAGVAVLPEIAITEELRQRSEGGIDVVKLTIRYKDKWMLPALHAFTEVTGSITK